MELPVQSSSREPRRREDVRALGIVLQANLVQLRVEARRRAPDDAAWSRMALPSPGAVIAHREALIDRRVVRSYAPVELRMRWHEQWGAYCALCWLIQAAEPAHNFGGPLPDADMHCAAAVDVKIAEVHAFLWRLRYELAARRDPDYARTPSGRRDALRAARIPLALHGKTPENADNGELLDGFCEHIGMVAALRWAVHPQRSWGDAELIEIGDDPF